MLDAGGYIYWWMEGILQDEERLDLGANVGMLRMYLQEKDWEAEGGREKEGDGELSAGFKIYG